MTLQSHTTSRWSALILCASLIVLIAFAAADLGGAVPKLPAQQHMANTEPLLNPIHKAEQLFSSNAFRGILRLTNSINPFFTTHFQPPPASPPSPTRRVDVVYQGFYQTADGQKLAFIKIGDSITTAASGAKVGSTHTVGTISFDEVVLIDSNSKTNVLRFNTKQQIDIPAQ
jgi:hypothetical protein